MFSLGGTIAGALALAGLGVVGFKHDKKVRLLRDITTALPDWVVSTGVMSCAPLLHAGI